MPSKFDNLSDGDLADELGALKAEAADLKARKEAIEAELIRRDADEAEGALFRVTVSAPSMRCSLSTAAIRADMPESWIDRYSQWSKVKATVNVTARTGKMRRAA